MSVRDVVGALARRWGLIVVGVLLTGLAGVHLWTAPGVYHQQVNVLFLLPPDAERTDSFTSMTDNLINLAGVVERVVNDAHAGAQTVSGSVQLQDIGVREGFAVRLPNAGGQWLNNFNRPLLNVQAVGPTADSVRRTMGLVLARVDATLRRLQLEAGVKPELQARTLMNPTSPPVQYSDGNRPRAVAVAVLLGLGLTVGLTVLADGGLTVLGYPGRSGRRRPPGPPRHPSQPEHPSHPERSSRPDLSPAG